MAAEHLPPTGPIRIVHGDYRLDNLIVAKDSPKIIAVLDWELSTLGDPLADFSYHLMAWHMPHSESAAGTATLAGHDLAALGIPSMSDYVDLYVARTGSIRAPFCRFISPIISSASPPSCRASSAACVTDCYLRVCTGQGRDDRPLARTAWDFAQQA